MARHFFGPDMERFIDVRCDWRRWSELRRGADAAARARGHWHEEATLRDDGVVVVPSHIADGYARLRAAGLLCLPLDPAYGGYGLLVVVNTMVLEMIAWAEPSLMTIVGLQSGVAMDIEKYGDDALKQAYLPRFASGELQGAMDLTEAEAGSDLGGIHTRAVRSRN